MIRPNIEKVSLRDFKNMTEHELTQLIKKGESQTLEFKTSLRLRNEIGETISAFSNTNSGIVLVGVSDEGKILGVEIGKKTVEDLANYVKENTDPQIYPGIKVHQVDSKNIIAITIKESKDKPVFVKDRVFQRVGKTNQRISATKIRELAQQERVKLHWDERICERATLDDIDEEKVKWFLEKAVHERRIEVKPNIPIREALERLELTRNGRVTNAAILLFGKNPQRFFLQAETRCGRFKGTKPVKPFIDMKVFAGSIIDQVNAAEDFVLRHISMAAWVEQGKVEREEKWEYPPDAIREAIVNALCHRDYEFSSNVQVRIFDDRAEVWGCGSLPEPLTLESLKGEHKSVLRNPLIGKCFFLIKFIEQWGTGTNDMIDMCLEWDLPEPVFEELSGGLVVTLRKEITEEFLREQGFNERQIKALSYIRERGGISNKEYQDEFAVSRATATRDLRALEEKGILKRVGTGRRDLKYMRK